MRYEKQQVMNDAAFKRFHCYSARDGNAGDLCVFQDSSLSLNSERLGQRSKPAGFYSFCQKFSFLHP